MTCPRSNGWTGAGAPPIDGFYDVRRARRDRHRQPGQRRDLNVFAELADDARARAGACRRRASSRARRSTGAAALGFDAELGTIEPGKRARLIAVRLPPGIDDVEEYLVSGVEPRQTSAGCKNLEPLEPLEP